MSLAGFCLTNCKDAKFCVSTENAVAAVDGNICRCTGYKSIERAAGKVADMMTLRPFDKLRAGSAQGNSAVEYVSKKKILPEYFAGIKVKLQSLISREAPTHHLPTGQAGSLLTTHLVGGGTDLYVQKHDEMTNADIRFVFDEPKLNGITKEGNKCIMGASVTVTDLLNSPIISEAFPDFHRYAKLVSSTPIRNMATIAGNFVNASPIGDFTIFFLALDAHLTLALSIPIAIGRDGTSPATKRELPLRKLYKGYKSLDKKPEEYIEQIWFEIPGKNSYFNFEKVSKRTHLDIASVNSAILITMKGEKIDTAGISAGGVGPVPMFLQKTSEFLKGKKIIGETMKGVIEVMKTEISPISDARGAKEYKTLLLGQLIKAHFLKLFPEIATDILLK
jgi:xanthine dehydrogenase small subunit